MPDPAEFLRPCQIDRGVPGKHDIPDRINGETFRRYIVESGRDRRVLARMRRRHPSYLDVYLKHHHGQQIVSVASIVGKAKA